MLKSHCLVVLEWKQFFVALIIFPYMIENACVSFSESAVYFVWLQFAIDLVTDDHQ